MYVQYVHGILQAPPLPRHALLVVTPAISESERQYSTLVVASEWVSEDAQQQVLLFV